MNFLLPTINTRRLSEWSDTGSYFLHLVGNFWHSFVILIGSCWKHNVKNVIILWSDKLTPGWCRRYQLPKAFSFKPTLWRFSSCLVQIWIAFTVLPLEVKPCRSSPNRCEPLFRCIFASSSFLGNLKIVMGLGWYGEAIHFFFNHCSNILNLRFVVPPRKMPSQPPWIHPVFFY